MARPWLSGNRCDILCQVIALPNHNLFSNIDHAVISG
jgi:hypothetical protein